MSESPHPDARRQLLSDLMDGQPHALQPGCSAWRDDAQARADWHVYHLIGDVLRSEDLAQAPGRDPAFLATLRERLNGEPVLLAPTRAAWRTDAPARLAVAHGAARRRGWMAPMAVAAGFVAVAGVLVVTRGSDPAGSAMEPMLASSRGAGATPTLVAVEPAGGEMVRNPALDAYLSAHKEYGNSSVLAVSSMVLSGATAAAAPRR